jgi:dihydrofolate reductase
MRKLIVSTFLSLDGIMQAPGAPEEDRSGGFTQGGWSFGYWDEMMDRTMGESMAVPFDLLLGRKTYEIFAAHWPHAGDNPAAKTLNGAKKYVASRSLGQVTWQNAELIKGDVASAVARLKQEEGPELQVHGSGNLIQTLLGAALIDELRLWVFPVVLGAGKRLFGNGTIPSGLALVGSKSSTTGVLICTYRPAGAIKGGSFALDQPTEAEIERRAKATRGQ